MCTVSFLPVNKTSFILTHNRDEHINRGVASLPSFYEIRSNKIVFPKDSKANGTWISTSKNYSLCLLNGGFEKHKHEPPYKHSRGQLILDFFNFENSTEFLAKYNFQHIEPFTLIILAHNPLQIIECVWTGNELFTKEIDVTKEQFWCSSTLYDKSLREKRKNWFNVFILENKEISQHEIINFHLSQPDNNEEGIQINRNGVLKTVSLTSISKNENNISMYYQDLIENTNKIIEL